jgi:hypothetical protein
MEEVIRRVWAVIEGELDEKWVTLEEVQMVADLIDETIANRVIH